MSLNNMKVRLNYMGGASQVERMNKDKLKSLKKALFSSYQAATVQLSDGREFRCLINPNKLSLDLDNKIISIPFKNICLNAEKVGIAPQEEIETNIKEGDVIKWKENGSHWIVYLQRLEETAYFRADLRRCHHQIELSNGHKYWAYIRGPVEQAIVWTQGEGNYINKLNHTLQMYVSCNEETLKLLHRFAKIKINGNSWEVQAIDSISTPGIIEVVLKESYNNTPEEDPEKAAATIELINPCENDIKEEYIYGPINVYPYETHRYELKNSDATGGYWQISNMSRNNAAKIISCNEFSVDISILTGKSATVQLDFITNDNRMISLPIQIKSL